MLTEAGILNEMLRLWVNAFQAIINAMVSHAIIEIIRTMATRGGSRKSRLIVVASAGAEINMAPSLSALVESERPSVVAFHKG